MQLTGTRIPDPIIATIHDVHSLYAYLLQPPKPKKLAQTLLLDERITSLPNVKVYPRRVTPIDKDHAVGRWKVIETELVKRGLPVVGRA